MISFYFYECWGNVTSCLRNRSAKSCHSIQNSYFTYILIELIQRESNHEPLNKDATEEEKKFYEECKHDYKVMHETAKKLGIKNPIMEIPFEVDF